MDSVYVTSDTDAEITVIHPEQCGPCKIKARDRSAQWYCTECDDFICLECKGNHGSFKLFASHRIVSREMGVERKDLFMSLSSMEICRDHRDKKLEFFCPTHKSLCCSVCVIENHTNCKCLLHVEDKNRREITGTSEDMGTYYTDLHQTIVDLNTLLATEKQNLTTYISSLTGLFKSMRDNLLALLEKAETNATEMTMKMLTEEQEKLRDKQEKIDALETEVQKTLDLVQGSRDHGSERQQILTELKVYQTSQTYGNRVSEFRDSMEKLVLDVRLKPKFLEEFGDFMNMYKIESQRVKTGVSTTNISSKSPDFIQAKLQATIDAERIWPFDREESWITGCTFLPDSSLLLADRNNEKLKVYTQEFTLLCDKWLNSWPWDVAAYDFNEFAVTLPDLKRIQRYSLDKQKEKIEDKGFISVKFVCYGIAYISSEKLVITGTPCIVNVVQIDGTELKQITDTGVVHPYYVYVNATKSVAYVSDNYNHRLCAIDLTTNKVDFTYSHDALKSPRGVTTDRDGTVFVCGTDNVLQTTTSGQHVQILLAKGDIVSPNAIDVSPCGSLLVVTECKKRIIKVFYLTKRNTLV